MRRFLGLAGYYRQFVPNFSDLASPLTDLTRKRAPDTVQWSEPCQVSFEAIQTALCGKSVLCAPNFDLPFSLQTDASDRGLGAVLTQQVEGVDHPVLYLSRKLSDREGRNTMQHIIHKLVPRLLQYHRYSRVYHITALSDYSLINFSEFISSRFEE